MVHYYYYIEAGTQVDNTSTIYNVTIGTCQQAQRDFLFLTSHAVEHGHYFEIRSAASTDFVSRIRHSVDATGITIVQSSARDLVRYFKGKAGLPLTPEQLKAAHRTRFATDIDYRISCNLAAAGKLGLPSQLR